MTSYVLRNDDLFHVIIVIIITVCMRSKCSVSLSSLSDGDRWGGVPADGGHFVPDVLQRRHPHPPPARLLHHRLALAAGRHLGALPALCLLLLVRSSMFLSRILGLFFE